MEPHCRDFLGCGVAQSTSLGTFPALCAVGAFPSFSGISRGHNFIQLQNEERAQSALCARGTAGCRQHAGRAVQCGAGAASPPGSPAAPTFFAAPREGPDAIPQTAERADSAGFPEAAAGKAARVGGGWGLWSGFSSGSSSPGHFVLPLLAVATLGAHPRGTELSVMVQINGFKLRSCGAAVVQTLLGHSSCPLCWVLPSSACPSSHAPTAELHHFVPGQRFFSLLLEGME